MLTARFGGADPRQADVGPAIIGWNVVGGSSVNVFTMVSLQKPVDLVINVMV